MPLTDPEFRARLQEILERSGRSKRQLSAGFGRDPGYVAALLDPTRPSRARPTPADLLAVSDATEIPFVELLERLWEISPERLRRELDQLGIGSTLGEGLAALPAEERASVADFVEFLGARRRAHGDLGPGRTAR